MRPAARLAGRLLLAVMIVDMLAVVAGCSMAPETPAPEPAIPETRATTPSADDAAYMERLVAAPQRDFETTTLANLSQARRSFRGLIVPRDTLGRQLVGIVHGKAKGEKSEPREYITLVYEGGLVLTQSRYAAGLPTEPPTAKLDKTRETTGVGEATGVARTVLVFGGEADRAMVEWSVERLFCSVRGPGLTKDDVVRVARSMAP